MSSDTVAVKIWFSNGNAKPLVGVNTVRSAGFLVLWPGGREHQHSPGEGRNDLGLLRSTNRAAPKFFETTYLEKYLESRKVNFGLVGLKYLF